jgi:hypothetical protein
LACLVPQNLRRMQSPIMVVILASALAVATFVPPTAAAAQHSESAVSNQTGEARRELIARSIVWLPTNIPAIDLKTGPPGNEAFAPGETVDCDYVDRKLSGATPKFACRIGDGHELKIKYGIRNGEVYASVAASRLLWALGFGADRMYPVRVLCHGCPDHIGNAEGHDGDRLVDPAVVERKLSNRELSNQWKWRELELIEHTAGGATIDERDALKLLAVLLQHTDSKAEQQHIVCVDPSPPTDGSCRTPMMMVHDLGMTFGRANLTNANHRGSMNLKAWASTPVWKDRDGCVGKLSGSWTGTLKDPDISEAGRAFLAGLLVQLSDAQLHDMFEVARVTLRPRTPDDPQSGFPTIDEWVNAFKDKRAQIVERRCPLSSTSSRR